MSFDAPPSPPSGAEPGGFAPVEAPATAGSASRELTTSTAPPPPLPLNAPPPPLAFASSPFESLRGLTRTLVAIFAGWVLLSALGVLLLGEQRGIIGDLTDDPSDANLALAINSDDKVAAYGVALLAFTIVTVALFLVWFARAYRNVAALRGRPTSRSTGSAVGWWFVPFANLVVPYQLTRETWVGSEPSDEPRAGGSGLVLGWWLALVITQPVLGFVAFTMQDRVDSAATLADIEDALLASNTVSLVRVVMNAVTAVLALVMVRRLWGRQQQAHANDQGPNPLPD